MSDYDTIVRLDRMERKIDVLYQILVNEKGLKELLEDDKKNREEADGENDDEDEDVSDSELPSENSQKLMSGSSASPVSDMSNENERRRTIVRKKPGIE